MVAAGTVGAARAARAGQAAQSGAVLTKAEAPPRCSAARRCAARRFPRGRWPTRARRMRWSASSAAASGSAARTCRAFETAYASLTGAKHCLATANGTSALITSLGALGIGPGDEVIVPPYTFVATINAVLLLHALPVFVDSDPETFQIDAHKIEQAITGHTRVVMPVHLGGSVADLDTMLDSPTAANPAWSKTPARRTWRSGADARSARYGKTGCFSFQASKNLNSGEGGAILTDDEALLETCYRFHNNSRGRRNTGDDFSYRNIGANLRMTEFQARAAAGADDPPRGAGAHARRERRVPHAPAEADPRHHAGAHVRRLHAQRVSPVHVPLRPERTSPGCRVRRSSKRWAPKAFLRSSGYSPLNKEPFLEDTLSASRLQNDLLKGAARSLARAEPLPTERSPLHRGSLAGADDAARAEAGHGGHRRSG